jgi:hypothetical protein
MNLERLDDPVAVRVDFTGGRATPVLFRRRGHVYRIREVAARWEERRGPARILYFSCLDDSGDLYQLRFDGADFLWRLEFVQVSAERAP